MMKAININNYYLLLRKNKINTHEKMQKSGWEGHSIIEYLPSKVEVSVCSLKTKLNNLWKFKNIYVEHVDMQHQYI